MALKCLDTSYLAFIENAQQSQSEHKYTTAILVCHGWGVINISDQY